MNNEKDVLYIQGISVCSPDEMIGNQIGLDIHPLDASVIPLSIRRRSSLATRLAITAAHNACLNANIDRSTVTTLFSSIGGEMTITDQLCLELTNSDIHVSPTQFHNSVHNSAAAYWSIISKCQQASTAMAAGIHTVPMTLVEAWSQLKTRFKDLLVVCYEEQWPDYIDQDYGQIPIAFALLLSTQSSQNTIAACSSLRIGETKNNQNQSLCKLIDLVPILALSPLFQVLQSPGSRHTVSLSQGNANQSWLLDVEVYHPQLLKTGA